MKQSVINNRRKNSTIWRYMSKDKLKSLFHEQALYFSKPSEVKSATNDPNDGLPSELVLIGKKCLT